MKDDTNPTVQETAPAQAGAIPGAHIKTISAKYARKINPALIDPSRQYESIDFEVSLWADVEPGTDERKALVELQIIAENEVAARIALKVKTIREQRQFRGNTSLIAVEAAFRELYRLLDLSDDESEISGAWAQFQNNINIAAANLAAQ